MSIFTNNPKNIDLITHTFHNKLNNLDTLFERDRNLNDFIFVSASDKYFGSGTFANETGDTTKVIHVGGKLHLTVARNGDMRNVPKYLVYL